MIAQVQKNRELSQTRPNWNLYVGDPNYKTSFLLDFLSEQTTSAFTYWKIVSFLYSFRVLVCVMFLLTEYLDHWVCSELTSRLAGPSIEQMTSQSFGLGLRRLSGLIFNLITANFTDVCCLALSLLGTTRRDLSLLQRQILMVSFLQLILAAHKPVQALSILVLCIQRDART
jgi:hypothetical protein